MMRYWTSIIEGPAPEGQDFLKLAWKAREAAQPLFACYDACREHFKGRKHPAGTYCCLVRDEDPAIHVAGLVHAYTLRAKEDGNAGGCNIPGAEGLTPKDCAHCDTGTEKALRAQGKV